MDAIRVLRLDVLADVDQSLADHAVKGRADAGVAHELGRALLLRLRGRGRPLLRGALRGLPVVVGARDGARVEQVLHALALALSLLELALRELRLGLRRGGAEIGGARVERREDLPGLDGLSALHQHLEDLAARVRRDVRLLVCVEAAGQGQVLRHRLLGHRPGPDVDGGGCGLRLGLRGRRLLTAVTARRQRDERHRERHRKKRGVADFETHSRGVRRHTLTPRQAQRPG